MNPKQISKIPLNTEAVDCIVFWTKNAAPMMDKLDTIDALGYPYYFQWTMTPYGKSVEYNLPDKAKVIDSFKALSDKIGSQRTIWRYDPIIISRQFPIAYHVHAFAKMCHLLKGYTNKCIFSYIDLYAKIRKRTKSIVDSETDTQTMFKIAEEFAEIAKLNNISLETCSEQTELSQFGIRHSACINKHTIETIIGYAIDVKKVKGQREYCQCIDSIDIGAYDCCSHGCVYCYATASEKAVLENRKRHDVNSPLLIGRPCVTDKITERITKTLKNSQTVLF
ncbi:hypothetical protein SPSIL_032750 [Sporomusa silvacetica DSM 10669]|uniref:DUF1848 domain-containing protein n=2 Tax=Sporomusa silvacetica TaxID=55504 RepID=A0ABZ3INE6_9FIRM|nr:hypothetical protein SPSIL_28310 [Sporomusa silvacetica DSM 10669]